MIYTDYSLNYAFFLEIYGSSKVLLLYVFSLDFESTLAYPP